MNRIFATAFWVPFAVTLAKAQCAIQPIKPIPPIGCKDVTPQCVSDNNGHSYWTWVCVPDRADGDTGNVQPHQYHLPRAATSSSAPESPIPSTPALGIEVPAAQGHSVTPISEAIALQRVAAAKTICMSGNTSVEWNKNSEEPSWAWADLDAGENAAVKDFLLQPCEHADLVVKYVYDAMSESVTINVTDADSGATVFRESRSISDLSSDAVRMADHWHEMVVKARTALLERQPGAEIQGKQVALNNAEQQAVALYNQHRYDEAFTIFQRACDAGSANACGRQGLMYAEGHGIAKDYFRALLLYTKACDGGDAGDCSNLGQFYRLGKGVQKDKERARQLYSKGCSMGDKWGCDMVKKLR